MRRRNDIDMSTPGYALQYAFISMNTQKGDKQEIRMSSRAPLVIVCLSRYSHNDFLASQTQWLMVCCSKSWDSHLQGQPIMLKQFKKFIDTGFFFIWELPNPWMMNKKQGAMALLVNIQVVNFAPTKCGMQFLCGIVFSSKKKSWRDK